MVEKRLIFFWLNWSWTGKLLYSTVELKKISCFLEAYYINEIIENTSMTILKAFDRM